MHKGIQHCEEQGIEYFAFTSFIASGMVTHAFSSRIGGISEGKYESLNLSILTDDLPAHVLENRRRFFKLLKINTDDVVGAHQVHKDRIHEVSVNDKGRGAYLADTVIPETDALMTDEKGITLTAFFADCVPVFFLDPVKKAIAIAHAGWKGTVAKIAAKTAMEMARVYGSGLSDLLVGIGPSIGPCHYQVDQPVINQVKTAFPKYWQELLTEITEDGHAQLDLWSANALQLEEVGVMAKNITVASLCTFCNRDIFFSHRGGMAGRQAAVIMLK